MESNDEDLSWKYLLTKQGTRCDLLHVTDAAMVTKVSIYV